MADRRSRLASVLVAAVLAGAGAQAKQPFPASPTGFELGVALGAVQLRDDALAPFRWTGPLVDLSASGSFITGRIRHQPKLSLSVAYACNRYGHGAAAIDIGAGYRLFLHWSLRLAGGAFEPGAWVFYRQHNAYFYSWDDTHIYWLTGFGVGPARAWRRAVSRRVTLGVDAAGSLLALASRPPEYRRNKQDRFEHIGFYFIDNFRNLSVSLPDRYQAADVRAGIEWRAGRGVVGAGYRLDLLRATWPVPGVAVMHGIWFRWHPGARR